MKKLRIILLICWLWLTVNYGVMSHINFFMEHKTGLGCVNLLNFIAFGFLAFMEFKSIKYSRKNADCPTCSMNKNIA